MKETNTDRTDPGKGGGSEEKSPEYLAFEAFARKVLSVPKIELDRREEASDDLADGSDKRPQWTKRTPKT